MRKPKISSETATASKTNGISSDGDGPIAEPCVGIFWLVNGRLLIKCAPISEVASSLASVSPRRTQSRQNCWQAGPHFGRDGHSPVHAQPSRCGKGSLDVWVCYFMPSH